MATIAELLTYPKGAPAVGVVAKVTKAFAPRTGTSEHGEWSVSDIELEDATGTIKGQWWYPEMGHEQLRGKRVEISATEDKKGNLRGAQIVHDEYQGEKRIRLKVQGAHLRVMDDQGAQTHAAPSQNGHGPAAHAPAATMTLTQLFGVADRAFGHFRNYELAGDSLAACVNTVLIAVTRGAVTVDAEPEETPPF